MDNFINIIGTIGFTTLSIIFAGLSAYFAIKRRNKHNKNNSSRTARSDRESEIDYRRLESLFKDSIDILSKKNEDGTPVVPEVCVVFHEKLLRGNRATKVDTDNFDAFRSPNYPPLAVSGIEIKYNRQYIRPYDPEARLTPQYEMDTHLIIFSLFPLRTSARLECEL